MAEQGTDRADPRLKPYRLAVLGLFFAVIGAFSILIVNSVVRSVLEMNPDRPPAAEQPLTVRECIDGADHLWRDLERHRKDLLALPAGKIDEAWYAFRLDWLTRMRATEARCALDSRSREPLETLFKRLEKVLDLYTTHAIQYSGEVGPWVEKFEQALAEARQDPAAGRLP